MQRQSALGFTMLKKKEGTPSAALDRPASAAAEKTMMSENLNWGRQNASKQASLVNGV